MNARSLLFGCLVCWLPLRPVAVAGEFRAGAVATDVSPTAFPRIIAGMFTERTSDKLTDRLHSRAIVLDDGKMKIAFAIVDQCMMEQKLIDEAKALASKRCGIPVERMMVSATHTHSAPAAMGCLGTRQDPEYAKFLIPKIAESIVEADRRLQPARIGWSSVDDWEHTHNRRWIRLKGKEVVDPFGNATGRANMHPGYLSKDVVGPSGPVDPQLSVISIQTRDGKPLAVLANYSQHYFGSAPVSADYFGLFCDLIEKHLGGGMCAMSQGTSGDLMWMDYGAAKKDLTLQSYTEGVVSYAKKALAQVRYQDHAELGMIEKRLTLKYRTPDKERLSWAQRINAQIQNDLPKDKTEVYAREAVILDQRKETTLKLQAIRIGDLSIATLPNEVFSITGLKLKSMSPSGAHFNIELANGGEGYIPPLEQHALGGYTTWPARTAGLEQMAESKIVKTLGDALSDVSGKPLKPEIPSAGPYVDEVMKSNPVGYARLDDMQFTNLANVRDETENTPGKTVWVSPALKGLPALGLPGVGSGDGYDTGSALHGSAFSGPNGINRAMHLSVNDEVRVTAPGKGKGPASLAFWFWLGHESGASIRKGTLLRAYGNEVVAAQDVGHHVRLEIGAHHTNEERYADDWHFAVVVRDGGKLRVHLDGNETSSLEAEAHDHGNEFIRLGQGLQGRLDEITVWDRAIEPKLIAQLWRISKVGDDNARHAVERAERARRLAVQKESQLRQHENWSVSMRFRNTKKNNVAAVTAYLVSRGPKGDHQAPGDHLGIGGNNKDSEPGRLFVFNGNAADNIVRGKTVIEPGSWNDVAFERAGSHVKVTLNGKVEIDAELPVTAPGVKELFFGRRCDDFAPLEGEFEKVAVNGLELPKSVAPAPPPAPKPELAQPALSPEESLKKLHVPEGFEAELVACEPVVLDPVAFDWDDRGRLWVVEMADYPLGMDGKGQPGSRVVLLEDTDADGRYDKRTVVAGGLNFATGILAWRDGVLVTAAPDIFFIKGDGSGKKALFTGFLEGNQQLRVNGLRWGLDGWVYCANGGHHVNYGKDIAITSTLTGEKIALGSRDFRFKPDTGEFDPLSGPSQFGRNRDAWNHWFGVQNSYPIWHYVLEDRYLRRNPHVAPPGPRNVLTGSNPPVYPLSGEQKRYHSFNQAGHFTSACSGTPYLDTFLFGNDGRLHSFTCEPVHDVVQHFILEDDGVSFKARRAESESQPDFFASEDRWCRPVMTRTGPDGALWVADMYRYMIEHPQWLPENGKSDFLPFYRAGDDKGRIYRIYPKGKRPGPVRPLAGMSAGERVALLESSNGWLRDRAQMLLQAQSDPAVIPALEKLATTSRQPLARAHALSVLEQMKALRDETLIGALRDATWGVREHALRLAESHPAESVVRAAAALADDADAKVRLQLACSLGEWKQPEAGEALVKLASRDRDDPMMRGAVVSSLLPHLAAVAGRLRGEPWLMEPLLRVALAEKKDDVILALSASLTAEAAKLDEASLRSFRLLQQLLGANGVPLEKLAARHAGEKAWTEVASAKVRLVDALKRMAGDDREPAPRRAFLATVLLTEPSEEGGAVALLGRLVGVKENAGPLAELVAALAQSKDGRVPGFLMQDWESRTPAQRETLLDAMMGREAWAVDLLGRVKAGTIRASAFDGQRVARLLKHPSGAVRKIATEAFAATANSSRAKVLEAFKPALSLKGDPARGKAVFAQACVACHQLEGVGRVLGPDLRSVAGHDPDKLLNSILDPSANIEPGFTAYFCELKNGEQLYGIIAGESGGSIVFKLADASTRNLLNGDIVKLQSSKASLMPDGLEALLTPQSLADLIAYLKVPK